MKELTSNDIQNGMEEKSNTQMKLLEESIKLIAKDEGFLEYTVESQPICANGGNYLAELYNVDIKGQTKNGAKEINLFVKNKIDLKEENAIMPIDLVYYRETVAYTELRKAFNAIQEEAQIPEKERYKMAKFYQTNNKDSIIMDNMVKQGYEILPTIKKKENMSLEYAETALKQMAKLHSLFYALEEKYPEVCKEVKTFQYPMQCNEIWRNFVINVMGQQLDFFKTKEVEVRVRNYITKFLNEYPKRVYGESRLQTLCHGDFRINNILTKVENGKITDQLLLDYQMIHYGNPIHDFMFFIYSGTDREFRQSNLEYLKDFYYRSLKECLERFGMIQYICPREVFEEEYKKGLEYGLMIALQFFYLLYPPDKDFQNLTEDDITKMKIVGHDFFVDRLNEVVQEFIDWGYL